MVTVRRRQFLAASAGAALVGTAGCLRAASDAGQRPLAENPVGQDLDDQPRLGPHHDETDITLVSFGNPNCGNCADFHAGTLAEIESEWVESGEATLYARTTTVTSWTESAVHALEEARRRAEPAYWTLKGEYYAHQTDLTTDNVVDRTRSFLAESDVSVDADAVAGAARETPHTDAIAADERAANAASGSIGFPTPTTYLFEDGEFVTTLGDPGFEGFEAAVESDG